jgi:hypothetical protein
MLHAKNCKPGQVQHEFFTTKVGRKEVEKIQYDYRTKKGELFSCVANTLDEAIAKRDAWFARIGATEELTWARR